MTRALRAVLVIINAQKSDLVRWGLALPRDPSTVLLLFSAQMERPPHPWSHGGTHDSSLLSCRPWLAPTAIPQCSKTPWAAWPQGHWTSEVALGCPGGCLCCQHLSCLSPECTGAWTDMPPPLVRLCLLPGLYQGETLVITEGLWLINFPGRLSSSRQPCSSALPGLRQALGLPGP